MDQHDFKGTITNSSEFGGIITIFRRTFMNFPGVIMTFNGNRVTPIYRLSDELRTGSICCVNCHDVCRDYEFLGSQGRSSPNLGNTKICYRKSSIAYFVFHAFCGLRSIFTASKTIPGPSRIIPGPFLAMKSVDINKKTCCRPETILSLISPLK